MGTVKSCVCVLEAVACSVYAAGCSTGQDFGLVRNTDPALEMPLPAPGESPRPSPVSDPVGAGGNLTTLEPDSTLEREWQWLNPQLGTAALRGVWASSPDNVWFVGDAGTVIRWDGSEATRMREGEPQESLYVVWSSGPDNVWVAGDMGPDTRTVLYHYDGADWAADFPFASHEVHSIWGLDETLAFAVTASGYPKLFIYDGALWAPIQPSCETATGEPIATDEYSPCWGSEPLREVWGFDRDHLWLVGDRGGLWSFSADEPSRFVKAPVSPRSVHNPYDEKLNYVGIWGSAADDVWALATGQEDAELFTMITVAHWDGQGWSAEQPVEASISPRVGRSSLRRGHGVVGNARGDLVQTLGFEFTPGSTFSRTRTADAAASSPILHAPRYLASLGDGGGAYYDFLGAYVALAVDGDHNMYAAGLGGQALKLGPSEDDVWEVLWDRSPPIELTAVAPVGENEAFAVGGPNGRLLARWAGKGWTVIPGSGPTETETEFEAISGTSPSNVWAAGWGDSVSHFDGDEWRRIQPLAVTVADYASIWARAEDDVWIAGQVGVDTGARLAARLVALQWDGATFHERFSEELGLVDVIPTSPDVSGLPSVFGTRENVWLAVPSGGRKGVRLFEYNGATFDERPEWSPRQGYYSESPPVMFATTEDDIWTVAPFYRLDGSDWLESGNGASNTLFTGLSGTGSDDIWLIGERSSDDGAIVRWDGQTLDTALVVPSPLKAIGRGPDGQLWVVGDYGATLRLPARTPDAELR